MIKYLALISILLFSCSNDQANNNQIKKLDDNNLVFNSNRIGNHEIYTVSIDGSQLTQITHDSTFDSWWPKISPDRTRILFYRAPNGQHEKYEAASLWVYEYETASVRLLRSVGEDGWTMQGHAEWSPDGKKIAMFGSSGSALEIFVTDFEGQNPVQYTNRGGYNTDVSWSPDGTKLLFNGFPANDYSREKYEIYCMDAIPSAEPVRLTNDSFADYDPYFSPDGKKISWLRLYDPIAGDLGNGTFLGDWAICLSNADGTAQEYLIQDGNINSKPSWSHDGRKIFFHRMPYLDLDFDFGIFSITVDTKELTRITEPDTGSNEYPMQ